MEELIHTHRQVVAETLRAMFPSNGAARSPVDWGTKVTEFLISQFSHNWSTETALELLVEVIQEEQKHPSTAIRELVRDTVLPAIVRLTFPNSPGIHTPLLRLLCTLVP